MDYISPHSGATGSDETSLIAVSNVEETNAYDRQNERGCGNKRSGL